MRIGFDTSALVRPHPPGIVRLVGAAMAALEETPGIVAVPLRPEPGENLLVWRQWKLPLLVRERELQGLHSFVSAFALFGPGLRVQTVHELPWLQGSGENSGLSHRFWARLGGRRAQRVVCGTEFVARQLGRPERVRVCPWGVDSARFAAAPRSQDRQRARLLAGLGESQAPGAPPLVLAIGAVRTKKNLAALLRGLHERRRRGAGACTLLVSGEVGPQALRDQQLARELGLESNVRWLGSVDDDLLIALLHEARCVAVLSRSEGFALPVLEAFATGTSVLVPKRSAQAEVAAGLGMEVEADDPTSVAHGLERALHDGDRNEARRAHARLHSWTRCALRIAEIWRECA